jgi:hypothetical protein
VGSLLPALAWGIGRSVRYIRLLFRKTMIVGDWFEYHWSFIDGKAEMRREIWKIRRGFRTKYTVQATAIGGGVRDRLSYRGALHKEGAHWLVTFESDSHEETVFCRLTSPLPRDKQIILGLQCCLDFSGVLPSVGPLILSEHKLDEAVLTTMWNDLFDVDVSARLVRVLNMVGPAGRKTPALAPQMSND